MAFSFTAHRGSANSKTPGTTLTMNPSAEVSAGTLLIIRVATDNQSLSAGSNATVSCTDAVGNTYALAEEYIQTSGVVGDGCTSAILWTVVGTAIATSDDITITGQNVAARAMGADEFSIGTTDIAVDATGGSVGASTDPAATGFTGTQSRDFLLVDNVAYEYAAGNWDTEDSDYTSLTEFGTSGGGPAGNVVSWGAYRISTLSTDQYDGQAKGAMDWASVIVGFYEAGASPISIDAAAGAIVFTGISGSVTPGAVSVAASAGTNVWTGIAGSVVNVPPARIINASAGSFVFTGVAGSVTPGAASVQAAAGSVVFTGVSGSVTPGAISVSASAGSNVFTGVSGSVTLGGALPISINATAGSFKFTGVSGSVTPGAVSIAASAGSFVWTGIAGSVTPGAVSVPASAGSMVWTGASGSVTPGAVSITASPASIVWTGAPATVSTTGAISINATAGRITWTGISGGVFIRVFIEVSISNSAVWGASVGNNSMYTTVVNNSAVYSEATSVSEVSTATLSNEETASVTISNRS